MEKSNELTLTLKLDDSQIKSNLDKLESQLDRIISKISKIEKAGAQH